MPRVSVPTSFPFEVDICQLGYRNKKLRTTKSPKSYFDLEDVLTLALKSKSVARRSMSGWKRGLRGKQLEALLCSTSVGKSSLSEEIKKIKWVEKKNARALGRARTVVTARAASGIFNLLAQNRPSRKPDPKIHNWFAQQGEALMSSSLVFEHEQIWKDADVTLWTH